MEARPRVLTELLNGNQQFEIPLYQRRYSWRDEERSQFWKDILRASTLTGNRFHFLGPVVFTKPESGMGGVVLTRARLIDGQQRLTTLTLLMKAVAEQLKDDVIQLPVAGSKDMQAVDASAITEDYLINKRLTGDSRYKLLPTLADRDTLKHILTGEPLPERHSADLLSGIQFFRDRLLDPGVTVEQVLKGLNRLEVVEVMLNDGRDDPQLIFESLNSTGKDLTPADLIRNNVLMGLKAEAQDELTRTYWLPIEALFEDDSAEVFNRFMRDYLTVRMRELVDKNGVYEAFKAYRETRGDEPVHALVADILDMAKLYAAMLHPERVTGQPRLRLALQDLLGVRVRVTSPFVLELLEDHAKGRVDTEDLIAALRVIESLLVRRAVSEFRSAPLNKLFASAGNDLVRDQGSATYKRSVERALMKFQDRNRDAFPPDEVFYDKLRTVDLYNSDVCRHILVRLERRNNPSELVATDGLTIEHIMPKNPDPRQPWRDALGPDWPQVQERLKHTLGNLTLTGYNSELGDRSFEEKKTLPIKAGDTADSVVPKGYKYSNIAMTRELAEEPVWNAQTIQHRADKLAQAALTLWPLPKFTDEELAELRGKKRLKPDIKRKAWDRLKALPAPLLNVVESLDERLMKLDGSRRRENRDHVDYQMGRRYVTSIGTDDLRIYLWLLLGEDFENPGNVWTKGEDKGWWQRPLDNLTELDAVFPLIEAVWAAVQGGAEPQLGQDGSSPPSVEEYVAQQPPGVRAIIQAVLMACQGFPTQRMRVNRAVKSFSLDAQTGNKWRPYMEVNPVEDGRVRLYLYTSPDEAEALGVTSEITASQGFISVFLKSPEDAHRFEPLMEAAYVSRSTSGEMVSSPNEIKQLIQDLLEFTTGLDQDITTEIRGRSVLLTSGGQELARLRKNETAGFVSISAENTERLYVRRATDLPVGQAHLQKIWQAFSQGQD
ncbi:DUF262 domain-containing protein [Deinococcus sp. JMULE3]|uniref:DUF262 domain-containing protein n=1 Tax=Deinococcus sp. JMULE3 TaxID=2518341 RepID=UPI001575CCA6|nr:DUF262 domain-containing protein [Deinococcus sp. JMULE3]NTY00457.1 DUF262 domain-containing protein [Deinococcus sp. JMULE3]